MPNIVILTPDPADEAFHTRWREVLAELAVPLSARDIDVEDRSWTDDLGAYDLVLPLLAWGYHRAGPNWPRRIEQLEASGVPLCNPGSVLRWNADKAYLKRLAETGAPVAPILFADTLTESALRDAASRFGTEQLIAKPRVSAGAWQTIRWSPGDPLDGGPTGAAIIQPYLPAIEEEGEVSLLYLGGRFSHAIRKRPQTGDFRVQPEYDGIITPHQPLSDEREAADAILGAVEEDLLYARVDLVRDRSGKPVLMELELVEPDLYLRYDDGAGERFAEAVARAIS